MLLLYTLIYTGIILIGGWLVVAAVKYNEMSVDRKLDDKVGGWITKQDYIVVQLFPPAENLRSMSEMENLYVNLASIFRNISEKDLFLEGKVLEAYSFEIHSRGGQVAFYVRLNRNYLPLLRSSLSAHYPGSDIVEVPDPFQTWPDTWEGKAGPYTSMAGTDLAYGQSDLYPLKSWQDFQRDDNTPLTDPVSTLITGLENIEAKDYAVIQFIIKPKMDMDVIKGWQKELKVKRQEFKENAAIEVGDDGGIKLLTKQEQNILNAAEGKITGENFHTKMRVCFFTATGGPNRMLGLVMAYMKQYASDIQFVKPDSSTKTGASAESKTWGPFLDKYYWKREQEVREKRIYLNMKRRSFSGGSAAKYINVKTLAALFHFPSTLLIDQSLASRVSTGEGAAAGSLTGGISAPRDLPT